MLPGSVVSMAEETWEQESEASVMETGASEGEAMEYMEESWSIETELPVEPAEEDYPEGEEEQDDQEYGQDFPDGEVPVDESDESLEDADENLPEADESIDVETAEWEEDQEISVPDETPQGEENAGENTESVISTEEPVRETTTESTTAEVVESTTEMTTIDELDQTAVGSLLPLREIRAYLFLDSFSDEELKAVPLSKILALLRDEKGNPVEIPEGKKVVWTHFPKNEYNAEQDVYHVKSPDDTVSLSDLNWIADAWGYGYSNMELIVGTGNQLDEKAIRYIVKVYRTERNAEYLTFEVYTESEDGSRKKIASAQRDRRDYEQPDSAGRTGNTWDVRLATTENLNNEKVYVGLSSALQSRYGEYKIEVYEGTDTSLSSPITDRLLNQDMSAAGSGYALESLTHSFIVAYYMNGTLIDQVMLNVSFGGATPSLAVRLTKPGEGNSYPYKYYDEKDGVEHYIFDRADLSDYPNLRFIGSNDLYENISDRIAKAVEGNYSSLSEAAQASDIKDPLFSADGYKTDIIGGKYYTVFFAQDAGFTIDHITVFVGAEQIENTSSPYFSVDSLKNINGEYLKTYEVNNYRRRELDTMYDFGYQTVMVLDEKADLSQLVPVFSAPEGAQVYAGNENEAGEKQISGETVQDFSKGPVRYTVAVNDQVKSYVVSVKKKETGPSLFVFGPSKREVLLVDYFDNRHDILIANMGDEPLTGLKATLDATNVKLDDYWTVGNEGNDTLAPFEYVDPHIMNVDDEEYEGYEDYIQYGELQNIAKIRLVPDGEGAIKGTLTISADGQKDVVIELEGIASSPKILPNEFRDGVKYVPYSAIIQTDNKYSGILSVLANLNESNKDKSSKPDTGVMTFELTEGELPPGMELRTTTGEIYGTPQKKGTYNFTVRADFGVHIFPPSTAKLLITIKKNTDENVFNTSNEGYMIETHIGESTGDYGFVLDSFEKDIVFTSEGPNSNFIDLWLNGERLDPSAYDREEGSTKITIAGNTMESLANTGDGENNTISMEFREDGDVEKDLHVTSQNFRVEITPEDEPEPTDAPEATNTPVPTRPANTATPTTAPAVTAAVTRTPATSYSGSSTSSGTAARTVTPTAQPHATEAPQSQSKQAAATGDETETAGWLCLMCLSAAAMVLVRAKRKAAR